MDGELHHGDEGADALDAEADAEALPALIDRSDGDAELLGDRFAGQAEEQEDAYLLLLSPDTKARKGDPELLGRGFRHLQGRGEHPHL